MALPHMILEPQPWNRATFFPSHDGPEIKAVIHGLESDVLTFETTQSTLVSTISPHMFLAIIQRFERITQTIKLLEGYGELWLAEDSQNQQAQAFNAHILQQTAELSNRTLFFPNWWKSLDAESATHFIESETLTHYQYWLKKLRALTPYTLPESEEHLISVKNGVGAMSLQALYDMMTARYTYCLTIDGETKQFPASALATYALGSNRDLRWQVINEVYRVFGNDSLILGTMYQSLVRDWYMEHVNIRGYPSPIAARNQQNDIPDEVVDTVLTLGEKNADLFHAYFRVKTHRLGIEKMYPSDIFAPVGIQTTTYTLSDAVTLIVEALHHFDPSVSLLIRDLFDANRVDTESRPGKKRGGWCFAHTPTERPWISVSYTDQPYDVLLLAHECGHAIHAMLAGQQSMLNYEISLPLAETASIFTEMLVAEYLIERESNPTVQQSLRFRQLDDAYASIQRQVFLTRFEQAAYHTTYEGGSINDLADIYFANLQKEFGPDVNIPESMKWEWLTFPVLYYAPFYSYSYALGYLLAVSLYHTYTVEGASFVAHYKAILTAAGSDAPAAILAQAGINIADPSFWQAGFDRLRMMIHAIDQTD